MADWLVAPQCAHRVWVSGRPTGYAGGANERAWKASVVEGLGSITILAPRRVGIEIEFRLRPDQVGRRAPDLDNLVKATVDAMATCIGARPVGGPEQADDERIDLIVARKRVAETAPAAGARIAVWPIDHPQEGHQ